MSEITRFAATPRMSNAVSYGGFVFLSGQVAINHRGGAFEDQAREVLQRIDDGLASAGTDKSRLLTAQLFLRDIADLPAFNAVWDAWLAPSAAPTRTTIQCALASDAYALEVMVSAAAR